MYFLRWFILFIYDSWRAFQIRRTIFAYSFVISFRFGFCFGLETCMIWDLICCAAVANALLATLQPWRLFLLWLRLRLHRLLLVILNQLALALFVLSHPVRFVCVCGGILNISLTFRMFMPLAFKFPYKMRNGLRFSFCSDPLAGQQQRQGANLTWGVAHCYL